MAAKMYVIESLSNMHVGSGDVNYGVVDNLIQRDPVYNLPNINASGLKGAIREFFKKQEALVKDMFGSDPKEQVKMQQGNARFFEANLLSIPIRSNKTPFVMATSKEIIEEVRSRIQLFDCENNQDIEILLTKFLTLMNNEKQVVFNESFQNIILEEFSLKPKYIKIADPEVKTFINKLMGDNFVVLDIDILTKLCDNNHLPVLARNNLENGESANLWYEQVLPRFSRLYFVFMEGNSNSENLKTFYTGIENNLIQIGANASIGYGFCKLTDISTFKTTTT